MHLHCWEKKDLIGNGTAPIIIKTLHGRFEFKVPTVY